MTQSEGYVARDEYDAVCAYARTLEEAYVALRVDRDRLIGEFLGRADCQPPLLTPVGLGSKTWRENVQ